jgi:hypothetical protein
VQEVEGLERHARRLVRGGAEAPPLSDETYWSAQ